VQPTIKPITLAEHFACLFWAGVALLGLWISYGCTWDTLYLLAPYHRLQAQALLHGTFALSNSILDLDHDIAWFNGGVQQIWGLGVALWTVPFHLLWNVFDRTCPDMIPMLVASGILGWQAGRTGVLLQRDTHSWTTGHLLCCILIFASPVLNLALARRDIYNFTVLYACIFSQILLLKVLQFIMAPSSVGFLVISVIAGLSGFFRPTHLLYGGMAMITCLIIKLFAYKRMGDRPRTLVWVCGCLIAIGGASALLYSNKLRFGSPFEFGHRLTISTDVIVYPTRFSNPLASAKCDKLAIELFSWIFFSPFHRFSGQWDSGDLVPFQCAAPRWRDVYTRTFDPSWILLVLASIPIACREISRKPFSCNPSARFINCALLIWLLVGFSALFAFYIKFATLSSRYILDFAPCLLAAPLIVALSSLKRPTVSLLLSLWCCITLTLHPVHPAPAEIYQTRLGSAEDVTETIVSHSGRTLESFSGHYDLTNHPVTCGNSLNGKAWRFDGAVKGLVQLMLDSPKFLEVCLPDSGPADLALTRAKINSVELNCTIASNHVIRFDIPDRYFNSAQMVSLCFITNYSEQALTSTRQMISVRWR
jgi:hypothetical protein